MPPKKKTNPPAKKQAKEVPPRRARPKTAIRRGDPVFSRYLKCISTGMPSQTGVPDGNPNPSFVRNLRQVVTLKPDSSGNLSFYIVTNPLGTIHQIVGAPRQSDYWIPAPAEASGILAATGSIEKFLTGPVLLNAGTTVADTNPVNRLRLVSAVHTISYTGPALYDSGTVTVDQRSLSRGYESTIAVTGRSPRPVIARGAPNLTELTSTAMIGSTRKTFTCLHLPHDTEYTTPSISDAASDSVPGVPSNSTRGLNWSNLTDRYYVVKYTGLDAVASITIDCRVCVQEELSSADNSMLPFAKPSENSRPGYLRAFLNAAGAERLYDWGLDTAKHMVAKAAQTAMVGLISSTILRDEL